MNKREPIIIAKDVSKLYRLYEKPNYRFLDMMGLLKYKKNAYIERAALDRVSLEIMRGEKVAIIGRNGAGKSTLLKMISGVLGPSSGDIEVRGKARALLQIGTGFHMDFTGRENVKGYLAQLGVAGPLAEELLYEVTEFAELEEYIDQPLKTYSSGMAARLMFATSTAVAPDLLILDEVLSVGDAYFTHKCMEKITKLCEQDNTTLLLVSHNVYDAAMLSERMIWFDKGRIIMDGEPQAIVNAYEDSIRTQEEARLRKKTILALEKAGKVHDENDIATIEFVCKNNNVPEGLLYLQKIRILAEGLEIAAIDFAMSTPPDNVVVLTDQMCWGEVTEVDGRKVRPMLNYGSPHHKVALQFKIPALLNQLKAQTLSLEVDYQTNQPCEIMIHMFVGERAYSMFPLPGQKIDTWLRFNEPLLENFDVRKSAHQQLQFGTGDIVVSNVRILNAQGTETSNLQHGEPIQFEASYEIRNPNLVEELDILLTLMRNGVEASCRFFTRQLSFNSQKKPTGQISLSLTGLGLGAGKYGLSILCARNGYFDQKNIKFYTINPDLYFCIRNVIEFEVQAKNHVSQNTHYVAEGEWSLL